MSDAYTDIAHDEERSVRYVAYGRAFKAYLTNQTAENLQAVIKAAKHLDALKGSGYWLNETHESNHLEELLHLLTAGDERTWKVFLGTLKGGPEYDDFKKLSPFKEEEKNG